MSTFKLVYEFMKNRKLMGIIELDDYYITPPEQYWSASRFIDYLFATLDPQVAWSIQTEFNKVQLKPGMTFQRLVVVNFEKCSGGRDTIGNLGCYQRIAQLVIQDPNIV